MISSEKPKKHSVLKKKELPKKVKDTVVPPERSEEIVEALKANGGNVKFTLYPDAGHDSWTRTYDNPELYEWLLKHSR